MLLPRLLRSAARSSWALQPRLGAAASTRSISASAAGMTHKDVTTKLLQILTTQGEMQEYLRVYGTPGVTRTAVIKIGGEVIENELDTLVESLAFLQHAGLSPILVHGAGPQMNDALAKAGVEPQYVGGNRVTDKATLTIAKKIFLDANRRIVDALLASGVGAQPITSGVFEAQFKDLDVYGYVGEISQINSGAVESALHNGLIPVLSCLGETPDGQTLNINADVAARQLAMDVQPFKTVFINAKGGWIEDDGTKLAEINMSRDYKPMASRDYTGRQGTLLKLNEIRALLEALPSSSSVALTSAKALSREILSSCSAGTVCIRGEAPADAAPLHSQERKKFRVGLIGARGYVGREIIQLIGRHPDLELVCASSRALAGQSVLQMAQVPPLNPHTNRPAVPAQSPPKLNISNELEFCDLGLDQIPSSPFAESVDVWILALPNGHCEKYAKVLDALPRKDKLIVDMSADQRFNDKWTYGIPEAPTGRTRIQSASHIANPGCYATGSQLGLLPLLGGKPDVASLLIDGVIPPHIFGVSGYSGAGTGPSTANNLKIMNDNILAYKSVNHIHEHEISHQLGTPVRFMPHVAPFFQGIHLTIATQLKDPTMKENDVYELFRAYYNNEELVHVVPTMPQVKENAGKHHVTLGGFQIDPKTGRLVLVSTIDNLLKGAATQAIQNINVALGIDEYAGILHH